MTSALSSSRRAAAGLATVVLVALVTTGCALGDKQAMADRVINAARKTETSGGARATVSIDTKVIKTKVPVAPGPPKITPGSVQNLATVIDFGARRAALGIPAGDVAHAAAVFDGTRMFERRDVKLPSGAAALTESSQGASVAPATAALSNLLLLNTAAKTPPPAEPPATEAPKDDSAAARLKRATKVQRRWVGFDFASLDKKDTTKVAGSYTISPVEVTRLAAGALPGSMKMAGTETIDGVATTHYRLNVSRSKAQRRLPESERKDLDKVFRANAIGGDVFHAEAWVGSDGRLHRFTVTMRQTLDRTDRDDLTVTIDLQEFGVAVAVSLPDAKETSTVRDLGQLVHVGVGT